MFALLQIVKYLLIGILQQALVLIFENNFSTLFAGLTHILVLNSSIIAVCVLFAIYMPNIGTVLRYDQCLITLSRVKGDIIQYVWYNYFRFSGAACGLVIIFALPILVYLASVRRQTGSISTTSLVLHSIIILLGTCNFLAQFLI